MSQGLAPWVQLLAANSKTARRITDLPYQFLLDAFEKIIGRFRTLILTWWYINNVIIYHLRFTKLENSIIMDQLTKVDKIGRKIIVMNIQNEFKLIRRTPGIILTHIFE